MKIKSIELVTWPDLMEDDNFTFRTVHPDGVFTFTFRWFHNRWNAWCVLPTGERRRLGVTPNVISWSGFLDYGAVFSTSLSEIGRNGLKRTELYLINWE